ncbi:hypothetical protein BDV95DRAFT_593541 [Massariosphaeria phaeospora]|uniref:Uncharacterized protein n=1 Tax=Massariosphaeria phaeospora TaxID=100035 RepID=A0A7C8MCE3_9PLEO|nr:hypothetical protein BDV95DRAFT_593541 [Massariosphaeria phaeospora]
MFGHPGISAFEFAGAHEEIIAWTQRSHEAQFPPSTQDEIKDPDDDARTTETIPIQLLLQEPNVQQRQRGNFINHTPRKFEMRTARHTDLQSSSVESYTSPPTSYQGSSGGNTRSSSAKHRPNSSLGSWSAQISRAVNEVAPTELFVKDMFHHPNGETNMQQRTVLGGSFSNPVSSKATNRSPQDSSSQLNSEQVDPIYSGQDDRKRRRRQTPFKISASRSITASKHSPLEPWVARHRRVGTGGTIDDLPPQVDIDDIAETSTFRAIQDYFDSQVAFPLHTPDLNDNYQGSSIVDATTGSTEQHLSSFTIEPTAVFPIEDLGVPQIPDLPDRNPDRLHKLPRSRLRCHSESSLQSDLASAIEGEYSPYEKKYDALNEPKTLAQLRLGPAASPGSSTMGRMAPPVSGHAAITASTELNDLCFYLKNTGPSPEPSLRSRKNSGLKMFKVKGKKSLAARVGSVEGSPQTTRPEPVVPACARETRTLGGAKHLRIVIPASNLDHDRSITLPVSRAGSKRRSRHVSIAWTDEMLNPLASPELEHAIADFNAPYTMPPAPPPRSSRRSPKSPKPIPVDDHPLATREEQTRARKLRDLKRIKRKEVPRREADTVAGALSATVQALGSLRKSPKRGGDTGDEESSGDNSARQQQQRLVSLQRQNTELAGVLAKFVGLDFEDGDVDAEAVLKACRQVSL